jgi:hypothetical protein
MHIYAWTGMLIHNSVKAIVCSQKPWQQSGKGSQIADPVHKSKMGVEISTEHISALVSRRVAAGGSSGERPKWVPRF